MTNGTIFENKIVLENPLSMMLNHDLFFFALNTDIKGRQRSYREREFMIYSFTFYIYAMRMSIFFFFNVYFLREREREQAGEGQRERGTEDPK